MSKYDNAMKLMEDFCGNGKDNVVALATIVLRITLTDGTITDNEKKYGEWMYKVDFAKREAV